MLELDDMDADILTKMLKASFSLENWTAMLEIADKLFEIIAVIHVIDQGAKMLKRSLVYYFGFSLCSKGLVLQKLGDYNGARECVRRYADLSWVKLTDAESMAEVEYYKNIAVANTYVIDLLEGKVEVLADYVEFIRNCDKDELIAGLITILESALKFNYSVDWALEELQGNIDNIKENESRENIRYYINYLYLLSVYLFKRKKSSDAINLTLRIFELCDRLGDETGFRKAAAFYEFVRHDASDAQQQAYRDIMKKNLGREFSNEKEIFVIGHRITD